MWKTSYSTLLLLAALAGCASAPRVTIDVKSAEIAPDPAMAALIEPYAVEVRKLEAPIGESAVEIENLPKVYPELGSLIADAIRAELSRRGEPVDVVFLNAGGIRADLPKGTLSTAAISKILPFENTMVVFEVNGEQAGKIFEKIAQQGFSAPISGAVVDRTADGKLLGVTIGGAPLDKALTYRVSTNSYLAAGGGGFDMLPAIPGARDTKLLMRDAMIEEVKLLASQSTPIAPPRDAIRFLIDGTPARPEAK